MMARIYLHKFADVIFRITQNMTLDYHTWSSNEWMNNIQECS